MTIQKNDESELNYDPANLLDTLIKTLNIKNEAALSRELEVAPPVICKVRRLKLVIGASLLIRMHESTNLSIKNLRSLMGDNRKKFTIINPQK